MMIAVVMMVIQPTWAKLEQVIVLSRHCDRTPAHKLDLPKNPLNWFEKLHVHNGDLTQLGVEQCSIMGESLYERYKDSIDFSMYNSAKMYFQSSSAERTILSLNAISSKLFPNSTSFVPVFNLPENQDYLLKGTHTCQIVSEMIDNVVNTKEYAQLNEKNQDLFHYLTGVTGVNISDAMTFHAVYDQLNCLKAHNFLTTKFTDSQWAQIQSVAWDVIYMKHSRRTQGNLAASQFLQNVLKLQIDSKYNYVHFSAHDTTIITILSGMDMFDFYKDMQTNVNYGAQIIFELHSKNNSLYVKFIYRNGYNDTFKVYKLPNYFSEEISFEEFRKYVTKTSIASNWCAQCQSSQVYFCLDNYLSKSKKMNHAFIILNPLLVIAIFLMISTLLILLLKRNTQKDQYQTLNS